LRPFPPFQLSRPHEAPHAEAAPSDARLIERTLGGEKEAFEGIVRRYQDRAYFTAMNLLCDAEDARDVAQEAFLRAFRALNRFDFSMSFYTWLYRIVVNLSIDQLRRRRRMRPVPLEEATPHLLTTREPPGRRMEASENSIRVHRILGVLPEKYRLVMVLRELEDLSCKEIATIVRSTHSTVRWRLHVARKMFRAHWEKLLGAEPELS